MVSRTSSIRLGGAINDVGTDRGIGSSLQWTNPTAPTWSGRQSNFAWNVTATSISMDAGVVTFADLESGHIDDALAMAVNNAASGKFLWPATSVNARRARVVSFH